MGNEVLMIAYTGGHIYHLARISHSARRQRLGGGGSGLAEDGWAGSAVDAG